MIYLDNAATTPLLPEVLEVMQAVASHTFGNPSAVHMAGREAAKILRQSRETIAEILRVRSNEILFTSGGSEANNLALIGYVLANQDKGKHIVTTAIEHPSVLTTLQYLRDRFGFEVSVVNPNADGILSAELVLKQLREDTILVSVMAANNETGQLLPIREIGQALKSHQAAFHVDAVQTMGKIIVDLSCIDFLSAAAHKFHGPKGVGFLYHKTGLYFDSLIHGGEQEDKRRAGTENVSGIAGMAEALKIATNSAEKNFEKVSQLKEQLLNQLEGINFYGNVFGDSLPHIINLGFPSVNHDVLLTKLDLAGICVSTGSACTAGTVEPSHVLEAVYGKDSAKLKENIRISLSDLTQPQDITAFTTKLKEIL